MCVFHLELVMMRIAFFWQIIKSFKAVDLWFVCVFVLYHLFSVKGDLHNWSLSRHTISKESGIGWGGQLVRRRRKKRRSYSCGRCQMDHVTDISSSQSINRIRSSSSITASYHSVKLTTPLTIGIQTFPPERVYSPCLPLICRQELAISLRLRLGSEWV